MKKIQSLLKTKPDAERINLSFLQIESINDIIFELYHFEKLKEIDLSCNRLTSLPKDLSILQTVERLDISSNLFEDLVAVFASLNTMRNLKELNLTFDSKNLKHTISYYMPRLEVINGEIIKAGGEIMLKNPIIKISEGKVQIERSKSASSRRLIDNQFSLFDDEFACIRSFFQSVTVANQENNSNPKYQTREYIEDNKRLEQVVRKAHEFNETLTMKIESGKLITNSECLAEKKKVVEGIIGSYLKLLKNNSPKIVACIEPLFKLMFILTKNIEQNGPSLRLNIGERAARPTEDKKKGLNQDSEIQSALAPFKTDNGSEKALLKLKLAELDSELHELRKENDDLYKFIIAHSKGEAEKFKKKMNKKYVQKSEEQTGNQTPRMEAEKSGVKQLFNEKEKSKTKQSFSQMKGYSLRQMNELIYDIMVNKKAYDARVGNKQVEPETLENFLYLYFKQKYGLKDLILVEVTSVVEKIKSLSEQSAIIEVFKRILKNELDEKFYWLLQSIKQNLRVKLENFYKQKVKKNASQAEIHNFVTSRLNGNLEFEECEYLLENSLEEREQKTIKKKFRDYFDQNLKEKDGKKGLSYFDFLEFIFHFEIDKHVLQLAHVSQFFIKADDDKDGMINRRQFLSFMDVYVARDPKINVQEIVKEVDPSNLNKITFSKVVEVLGSHFTDESKKTNLIAYLHTV